MAATAAGAALLASFFTTSSSSIPSLRAPYLSFHSPPYSYSALSLPQVKRGVCGWRYTLVRVNCKQIDQTESDNASSSSSSSSESPSSSAIVDGDDNSGVSADKWLVGLGGIGFLETTYLTFLKLTDSDAFCPTGGGSCTSILTSEYSNIFGVPLPLLGMLAYGLVTTIGLQFGAKKRTFETGRTDGEIVLLGITSAMAVASVYFLYILNTEFAGELCLYCLTSAVLSFSLFFFTLKRFRTHELQSLLGLQLFIACLVVIGLTASYNAAEMGSPRLADTEIPYFETEVRTESSPFAISLAKHLHSIGAKLYGAFWCSHCHEQEEMFGREASKLLDYIECFPDGASKETKMAKACYDAKIEGFPTWEINGEILNGEKELSELAILSGFKPEDLSGSK